MDLTNTTALVTGANRGIGKAFAEALAEHCAIVYAGARDPESVDIDADNVRPLPIDLSSAESIEKSFAQSRKQLETVDILVNNAGALSVGLLEEQDVDAIYTSVQVNLTGLIHLTKLLLPSMLERDRGYIVNNASMSGYAYFPLASVYAASKAGVVAFSESLRRELEPTGVGRDAPGHARRQDRHARRDRSRLRRALRHLRLGQGRARGVGARRWSTGSRATSRSSGPAARRAGGARRARTGLSARSRGRADVQALARDVALGAAGRGEGVPGVAVLGLGVGRLPDEDPALDETGLAVREVEVPEPVEALVVAVLASARPKLCVEVRPPAAQRLRVVRGDVLEARAAACRSRARSPSR